MVEDLELIAWYEPLSCRHEKAAHRQLHAYAERGEWFQSAALPAARAWLAAANGGSETPVRPEMRQEALATLRRL